MAFYNCPSLAMSRQTMGSITLLPVPFSAQLVLTGMTLGQWLTLAIQEFVLISCSVCEGLKNDEITVAGNQWPLLVYADCAYDPEGPWEGLFEINYLFGSLLCLQPLILSCLTNLQHLQTYIYFPKLSWYQCQGKMVWEHSHSWYDVGDDHVSSLCYHASMSLIP